MSLERSLSLIRIEIESVDRLIFSSYADLLELSQTREPNLVELTALGGVIHSFYNGVENIFLCIAKEFLEEDQDLTGADWHRRLLDIMTRQTRDRESVITVEIAGQLDDYLGFRHFFRHSYCDRLEWNKLEGLVIHIVDVWSQLKSELTTFLTSIEQNS